MHKSFLWIFFLRKIKSNKPNANIYDALLKEEMNIFLPWKSKNYLLICIELWFYKGFTFIEIKSRKMFIKVN